MVVSCFGSHKNENFVSIYLPLILFQTYAVMTSHQYKYNSRNVQMLPSSGGNMYYYLMVRQLNMYIFTLYLVNNKQIYAKLGLENNDRILSLRKKLL